MPSSCRSFSRWVSFSLLLLRLVLLPPLFSTTLVHALAMKEIYGVPNSGWTSPTWNWGYAQGTGHTCAAICRERYATRAARQALVQDLLEAAAADPEEIKLVLALEWQRGRWDGTDGGPNGYGHVLAAMAAAQRYEDETQGWSNLVQDMANRFPTLLTNKRDKTALLQEMETCREANNVKEGFLKCAGLVLREMGFIERGV